MSNIILSESEKKYITFIAKHIFNYTIEEEDLQNGVIDDKINILHKIVTKLNEKQYPINQQLTYNNILSIYPNAHKLESILNYQNIQSKEKKEVEWIEEMESNNIANELAEIKYKEKEEAIKNIDKIRNEAIEHNNRAKNNCYEVNAFEGKKIQLFNIMDTYDIFINEEIELDSGHSIKDSTFVQRADILRKHIHTTLKYPLIGVHEETIKKLEQMKQNYPNFTKVIEEIQGYAVLSLMNKESYFYMKPILLAGDPGVGKTSFAQKLSEVLGLHFNKLSLITTTAAWTITGMDLSWAGGKPGKIFEFLSKAKMANPIVMLDEIDKGVKQNSSGGNPMDTLHELLEKETSEKFSDEALLIEMNARYINWIATANILENIPESILSRFKIFNIPNIKEEHRPYIIKNVFTNITNNSPNKENIDIQLDKEIIDYLDGYNIRQIATYLESALGHCAKRKWQENKTWNNRLKLEIQDVKQAINSD